MFIPIFYIFPKTRKGIMILLIVIGVILLAVAGYSLSNWMKDQAMLEKYGQPDLYSLSAEQLVDGLIIRATVDLAIDVFAEDYDVDSGGRISDKSAHLYYVIPVYDLADDNAVITKYLMVLKAEPGDFAVLDKICEQTWTDVAEYTELALINGKVVKLPDDVQQLMVKWYQGTGFYEGGSFLDWCVEYNIFGTDDKAQIETKILPFMVYKTASAGDSLEPFWILLSLAAVPFIVMLFMIIYKKPKKTVDPVTGMELPEPPG
jgi:hypothetical protein